MSLRRRNLIATVSANSGSIPPEIVSITMKSQVYDRKTFLVTIFNHNADPLYVLGNVINAFNDPTYVNDHEFTNNEIDIGAINGNGQATFEMTCDITGMANYSAFAFAFMGMFATMPIWRIVSSTIRETKRI